MIRENQGVKVVEIKIGKKAMGIQQVFIFMVTAIVFAFIIIFGYKMVNDFLDKGEQVEFYQFKTDLENSIKRIYTEYGAVRQEEYTLPIGYEQICFVDLDADYNSGLCGYDPIACDMWATAQAANLADTEKGYSAVDENVFLQPSAPVTLKVYRLEIEGDQDFLCLNISKGHFTLRLEGMGSETMLSTPLYD